MQSVFKRWLVVVISFNRNATVLATVGTMRVKPIGKILVLSDLFVR